MSILDYVRRRQIESICFNRTMHDPWIFEMPNSLTSETCRAMIDKFENDDRKYRGVVMTGYDPQQKRTMDLVLSTLPDWKEYDDIIWQALDNGIQEYQSHLRSHDVVVDWPSNLRDKGYHIQRYDKLEGKFEWHNDFVAYPNREHREYTFLWYLNDVNEGGETEFTPKYIIRPEEGKLVIFPASWTYVHRGLTPISSSKYICTGWLCAPSA